MLQVKTIILSLSLCLLGYGQIVNSGGSSGGGGGGTVTSVTIAGTANQITATGTCTGTATITCTLSIPSAFVLPGTIDGLTITTTTGTLTVVNGKTLTVNKTLTLDGTDGVTLTFPATSATIARTDAGQTFTGTQVMTATLGSTSTATTQTAGDNSTKLATTAYVDTGLATKGMTLISRTTVSVAAPTVTFSSITGYTHLKLFVNTRCSAASTALNMYMQVNGDTGTNYTAEVLQGLGTAAGVSQTISSATAPAGGIPCANAIAGASGTSEITLVDYSGTTFNKMALIANNGIYGASLSGNVSIQALNWYWANTSAITSILLGVSGGSNFIAGSTFTLYGII